MKRPLGWICLLFLTFIFLFYVLFPPSLPEYQELHGREVYVNGQIISIKEKEVYGKLQIEYTLSDVTVKESSEVLNVSYLSDKCSSAKNTKEEKLNMEEVTYSHEKIYCYADREYQNVSMGSVVWIKGIFESFEERENPGQFDSRFYYHTQGVGGVLQQTIFLWSDGKRDVLCDGLWKIKVLLLGKVKYLFSEKYAGVMETILLGERGNLNKSLKQLFREGGILHILTISGLHISMLGMGCFKLMRKVGLSVKCSAVMGMIFVLLYVEMIGAQAATFRAICMYVLQMGAILLGRTYDRLTALSVAAVLLLLQEPTYVFYSGFLLSFGAVLGITIIAPLLLEICKRRGKFWKWIGKTFSGGIGILLATFPIQLYFYYEYPIYSMVINVLLLPLLPCVVVLGLGVLVIPSQMTLIGRALVYICQGLLFVFEWVCQKSQELSGHSLVLGAPKTWQIACYYIALLLCIKCLQGTLHSGKEAKKYAGKGVKEKLHKTGIILCASLCVYVLSVFLLLWRPVQGLTCHFLSVGQGDCAVLQCGKETYLVDCGSTSKSNVGTQILLPCLKYYGVSEVAGVFISHGDEDHMNGILQWLENYEHSHIKIKRIILPAISDEQLQEEFEGLLEKAEANNIKVTRLGAGEEVNIGELQIKILHPEYKRNGWQDSNEYSQVLLFRYQGRSVLMTGDIGETSELELLDKLTQEVTILKAPHHGSKYSSSEAFLKICNPKHIILSYGVGNAYGHPHREAVERMQRIGSTLWYTGRRGAITCILTDEAVVIKGFR